MTSKGDLARLLGMLREEKQGARACLKHDPILVKQILTCRKTRTRLALSSIKSPGWKRNGEDRTLRKYHHPVKAGEMSCSPPPIHGDKSKSNLVLGPAQVYLILSLYEVPELMVPAGKPSSWALSLLHLWLKQQQTVTKIQRSL